MLLIALIQMSISASVVYWLIGRFYTADEDDDDGDDSLLLSRLTAFLSLLILNEWMSPFYCAFWISTEMVLTPLFRCYNCCLLGAHSGSTIVTLYSEPHISVECVCQFMAGCRRRRRAFYMLIHWRNSSSSSSSSSSSFSLSLYSCLLKL